MKTCKFCQKEFSDLTLDKVILLHIQNKHVREVNKIKAIVISLDRKEISQDEANARIKSMC